MTHTLSIKKAILFGWLRTKEYWQTMLAITLISMAFSFISGALEAVAGLALGGKYIATTQSFVFQGLSSSVIHFIFSIILSIASIWLSFNSFKMMLKMTDGQEESIKNLFVLDKTFWKFLISLIIYVIIVLIGLVALIIPGIYFLVKFSAAPYLIFDKKLGLVDAFKKSYEITNGNFWSLAGLSLMSILIIVAGLILLLVGVIPATMIVYFASFYAYRKMIDGHVADEDKIN